MAVYKRGGVWWYEFVYAGQRIRETAKTTRKTVAIEAEKNHRKRLERAQAGLPTEQPEQRIRTVAAVLKDYEAQYGINHRPRCLVLVQGLSKHLFRHLGSTLLPDITHARVIEYIEQRRAENGGNRTINLELMVLSRAIGYTWKALWPKLKKLEENHDVGRALESDEENRLLKAAANNPSTLIYPFLMVLTWTGIRSDEARTLQWSRIDFENCHVTVGRSKTEAGSGRQIPMSTGLRKALEEHAALCARRFGPIQPGWYVFPFSNTKKPIDPSRPVTSLKTAWETIKTATDVKCRLHDLRHTFCTKLAEADTPESTMLDMMGHVSAAMLRRYSHIRAKARRDAIDAIEARASVVPTIPPTIARNKEKAKSVSRLVS